MSSSLLPRIIEIPKIYDPRGSLSFTQNNSLPFEIKRAYWIYDVPAGAERGAHSHKESDSLLVAMSGSFRVNLFDGKEWTHYDLNRPYRALYLPRGYWHTLDNFSTGACCMVLTSTLYDANDYIRNFDEFLKSVK